MKKGDDVFLFTLVDFLLQLFFFGLVLYVLMQARASSAAMEKRQSDDSGRIVSEWTGFSNITELSDHLSKLAPPEDFRGWADFLSKEKALSPVAEAAAIVKKNGGLAEIERKVKVYDEAYGSPPCEKRDIGGRYAPVAVARFRLQDETISIISETERFVALRQQIGERAGRIYGLDDFRSTYSPLRTLYPDCRFFADIVVDTKYLAPLDAFQAGFRINARR